MQVVVCGFNPELHVMSLEGPGSDEGMADDSAAMDAPPPDSLEARVATIELLRARTNLGQTVGFTAKHDLPDPSRQAWRSQQLYTLLGHDAACPSARSCGDMVVSASFDGTLKMWRVPVSRWWVRFD